MIALPAVALQGIAEAVLRVIEKNLDLDAKKFDALNAEEKRAAAKVHFETQARLNEHGRNVHAVLIGLWELLGGKRLTEPKADVSGHSIDGP